MFCAQHKLEPSAAANHGGVPNCRVGTFESYTVDLLPRVDAVCRKNGNTVSRETGFEGREVPPVF